MSSLANETVIDVAISNEDKVDGDEIYMASIKETNMVMTMEGLHPSTCMIGGDRLELTGDIDITVQQHIAVTAWLNDADQ